MRDFAPILKLDTIVPIVLSYTSIIYYNSFLGFTSLVRARERETEEMADYVMTLFIPSLMKQKYANGNGIIADVNCGKWSELRYACPKTPCKNRYSLYDMRVSPPSPPPIRPNDETADNDDDDDVAADGEDDEETSSALFQKSIERFIADLPMQAARNIYNRYYQDALSPGNVILGVATNTWDANIDQVCRKTLDTLSSTSRKLSDSIKKEFEWYKSRRLILFTLATLGRMYQNGCPMAALLDLLFPPLQTHRPTEKDGETYTAEEEEEEYDGSNEEAEEAMAPHRARRLKMHSADLARMETVEADEHVWFYPAETFIRDWSTDASLVDRGFVRRASGPRIIPLQFFPLMLYAAQNILSVFGLNEHRREWDLRNSPSKMIEETRSFIRHRLESLRAQEANRDTYNGHPLDEVQRRLWKSLVPMENTILPRMGEFIRLSYVPTGTGWMHGSYATWRLTWSRLTALESQLSALLAERDTRATGTPPGQLMQTLLLATGDETRPSPHSAASSTKKRKQSPAGDGAATPAKRPHTGSSSSNNTAAADVGDDNDTHHISGFLKPEEERRLMLELNARLARAEVTLRELAAASTTRADYDYDTESMWLVSV